MNTELIARTWDSVEDKHRFVDRFYQLFFQKYPHYRPLFPSPLNPRHLDKMTETMALLARLSDDAALIEPHVHEVGAAHRMHHLDADDLHHFRDTFVEMLAACCTCGWSERAAAAWVEAFDTVLIPMMQEGMR